MKENTNCKYCGSRFPHLKFKDGCEWKPGSDDKALACECGSVRWCLLESGKIECHECQKKLNGSWATYIDQLTTLSQDLGLYK